MRSYLETVISSAYFKVPEFRTKFLQCLKVNDQAHLEELQAIGLNN